MPQSSYVKRRLDVLLKLGAAGGNPGGPGKAGEQITVSGLRVSAQISKVGPPSQGALSLRIYGLAQSTMNKFSIVRGAANASALGNTVTVMAGDDQNGMSMIYSGYIDSALGDYQSQPDVAFNLTAYAALDPALKPVPPTGYRGGVDVAVIMEKLAKDAGLKFENAGVAGIVLTDPYFPGTAFEQIERAAEHTGINFYVDDGTLAIWPEGSARTGSVPLISPTTGMVGYPIRTANGVALKTLFNPALRFGGKIKVESSIQPCCGIWAVGLMEHTLECETPDGAWFTTLEAHPLGYIANT